MYVKDFVNLSRVENGVSVPLELLLTDKKGDLGF